MRHAAVEPLLVPSFDPLLEMRSFLTDRRGITVPRVHFRPLGQSQDTRLQRLDNRRER